MQADQDDTVLVVGALPPPMNGMTVMTAYVLEALHNHRMRHVHLDISDHREVRNVGRLDTRNVLLAFRHMTAMFDVIRRNRPGVVYLPIAQGTLGFLRDWLLFLVARWHRLSVVIHLHGAAFDRFYRRSNRVMRWVISSSLRPAQTAIVLGESLRGIFNGIIEPDRIVVVSNGIPDRPFFLREEARRGGVQVLFLSNLSVAKGYADVIEAASQVVRRRPDVRFTIAGEWSNSADSKGTAEALSEGGLRGKLEVIHAVTGLRKHQLFRSADIFVFPPRQFEGQPIVILEAMSYGLPVITTPQGGIRDTVVRDKTGVFVPPQDPAALADAICSLVEDASRRAAMGEAARTYYLQRFAEGQFQENLIRVLREAVTVRKSGPAAATVDR